MGNEASVEGGEAAVPPGVTAAGKQEKERRGSTVHRGAADALPLSRRSDVGATHSPQLLGNLPAQVSPGISKSQTIDALKTAPAVGQNSPGRSPSSVSLLEPRSHPQGREDSRSSMFSSNFLSGGNPFSAVSSAVNKLSIFGEEEAADEEALSSSLSSSSEDEEEVKKKKPPQQKKAGGPAEVAGSSKQGQGQSPQKSPPQKPGSQSPQQDGSPKPSAQIHQLPPKAEKQQQVLGKDKPQQAESPKSSPATGSRKATELQSQCPPTGDETSGKKSLCPLCKSTELNLHSREQPNYNTCTHCKSVVCSLCGFSPPDSVKEWLCLNCQMQWALGGMEPPGPQMIKTQQAPSKQALTPNSPQSKQPPQATPSSGSPQSKHPSTTKPDPKQVVGHGSPQSKSSLNQTCASPADREGSKPPETKEASKLDEQQSIPDTLKPTSTPADSKESASAATPSKCRSELLQETQNEKEMLDPAEIKPGTAASPAPTLQDPAKPAGSSKAGQPASGSPTLDPKKGPLTTRGNPENQVPKVGQGQPPAKSAPPSQAQPPKQESGFFGLSFGGLTESPKTQSTDPRSAAESVTGKLFGFSGFTEPSKPQPTAPQPAAESVTGKLFGFGGLTEVSKSLTAVQEPTAESITGKSSEPAKQETVAESLTGKLFGFGTSSEPTKPPSEPEPESVTGKFFGIGRITESAKPQPGVDSVSSKLFGFGGSTEPSKPQSSVQEQKMLSFVDSTESTKSQPTTQQTQRESVTEKFSGCTEENKPTTPHPPSESVTRKLFGIDTSSETTKPPIQQPLAGSISGKLFGFAGSTEPNKTQPTAQQPPTESLSGKLFGFSGSPETTKRQPEAQQPPSESLSGKLFGFSGSPETTKRQPEAHQPTAVKIFGFGGSVESTKSTAPKPVDSVSGKMFGFKSSFLSSASNLIASAVQDEQPIPPTQLSPKTSTKDYPQPQENHSLIKNPTEFTKASAPKSSETNCPLCKVELNMGSTDSPNYNTCTECKNIVCNLCGFNPMPHLAKNEWLCLNCQTQRALAGQLGDMGMMPPPMPTPSKLTPNPSAEIKSTPSAIAEVTSTSKTETDTFQIDTTVIETPSDSSTSEANSTKPLAQSVVPSETLTVSLESGPASTTPDPVHEVVVSDSSVEMVCSHLIPCVDPSSQSGSDAKVLSNKVEPTKLISTNQEPSSSPGIIGPSTHEIVSSVEDPTFPIETTYTSTESATSEPSSDISVPELASPELTSPETETIATLVEYSSPVKVSLAEQESNNSSGLVTKSTLDEEVIILDSNSSAQDNEDSEESKAEPSSDLSKIEVPSDNNQYEECSSVSSGPHYEAVGHAHCTEVEEPIISSDPSPSSNAVSCSAESEEIPFEFSSQSEVFEHSVHSETITSTDHNVEHARHSEVTVLNEHEAAQTEQSEQYNYFFKFDSNSEIQQCSTVHDFQSTGVGDPMEAEACVAYVESEGVILKTDCLSIDITTSTEQDPALGKPPIGQEAAFTEPSTSEAEIVTVTTQKADAHCDDIHHPGVDVPVEPKEILSQSSIPLKTACTCIEPETFPTEYVSTECAATPAEPKNAIPDPESLSEDTESIGEQEISSPETPTDASTACTSPLDVVTESISYQSEIIKSPGKTEFQIPDDSHQYKNNTAPREYDISFCDSFNESDIDIVPIEPECDIHEYISKTENIAVAAEPGTALYEQSPQLESLNSKERESFSELSPSINVNMFVAENKTNVLDRPVTPHSVYNAESPTVPPEIIPLSSFASTESFVDAEATTQKFGIENLVTSFDYDASVPQSVSPTFSNSPSPKALPRMKAVEDEEPAMAKEEEQIIVAAINQLNETFKPDTNQQACHQTLGDKGRTPDGITQGSNVDVLQDRGEIKDEVEPLLIEQATNKDNENKDSCCENEKALMQKTITKMNINKELIVNQEHGSGHPINEDNIERIQKHHLHGRLDAKAVNINDLETDTTSKETILGIRSLELKLNTCPHYKDQVLSVQENKDVELDMETGIYSPEERSREGSSSLHASSFTPGTSPTSVSSLDEDSDSSPGHKWISEDSKPRRTRHRQHGQVLPTIEDSSEEEEMREEEDLLREQEKYKGHFYHIKKSSNKKTKKDKEEIRAQRRRERPITPPSNLSPIEDASPTEELRQAEEMEELHRSTSNTPCSEFYPEGFFVRTEKTVPKESEEISLQGPKSQDELYTDALLTPKLSKPSDMNETTKQETGLSPSINETCFVTISSCDTVSILKDYEQEADVEPEKGLLIKQDNCPPPPTPEVIVFSSKDNANDINIEDHIDTGQNVMQESIPSDTHLQKALYPIPDLKITQCSSGEEDIDEEDITTQNQQSALETVVTTAVQADIAEIEPISVICEVPETKVVLPHISPASASDVTSVLLRNHASTFVFEVPQQNTTPGVAETVNVSSFLSDDGASVPSPPNVTEEETISVICQIPEQKDFQNANVTLEFDTGTGVPPEIEPIAVVCEVPQRIASQASYLEKGKLSVSISPDTASNLPSVELEPIVVVCQDLHSITSTTPCPVSTHAPCELLKKTDIDTEPLSVVCEVPLPKKIVKPPATHLQPSSNASQQFPLFPGSVSVTVLDSTLALDKKLPLSFHSEESPFPAVSPVPGACLEFGPSSVFTTLSGLELSTPPISCCSPSTTSTSSLISANISHSTSSSAVAKLNYSASVMVDISPKHSSAHLTSGHSSVSQTVAVSSTLNPVSAPPPILTFYQSTKQPGIILEPILDAISTNAPEKKVTETESLMAFSSTVEVSGHTFSVVTTAPIVFSSPRPTAVVTVSPLPPISQYYPAVSSMVATAIPPTSLTTSITSVPPLPPKTTLLLRGFSQEKNDKPISSSSLDFPFTTLQSSTQHGSAEKQEVKSSINQEPVTTCIPAVPVSTTATTVTMANSTITTTDQMYKPSVPVPSSANEGLVQKSISIDKQPVFVNPTQINQAVGNTQLCPIDSACSPVMTLNLNAPCERRSATSPTKSPLSPRQGKFFHETYVVITLPSEPPSPTDTISTQASTSQDSVKLVSTASVLPVVSTQNKETVVVQDEQKPKKVASSLSHVYSALPSGLSSSLPNLVTQELTTEFKRSTVSLACDTLEGISQTISRETTSVSSIAPSEFVKQQAKAKENGHMHFPRDVVDLSTLKFSAQMTEKGMDLSNPDSGRQSVLSDSSGRQTSAVHSPVVNLSAELASASNLTVVTDSITIVACTATIAYINNAVDRPLTVSASLPMPVQLATSKSFEPVTQIIYKPVVSQPSISDVDFPINLSFGSSTKSETYKTFPSNEKVVLSTSSNSLPARLEAGLTRAVDLTTTKHARALVSNDGLTSEVTSSMFKEDGMPVDLTGGRPAVCCDVVYKLPFAGSCTAEQPTTTLPEDRFGYRDDHYQYNCSGANVTKGFAGLKSSMSDTNLAEAGLFFYTAKNSFEYQNGTMEGAMDLTSGKLPTGVRQYSGTTGLPYFQAVSADEAQFGLNVIKYSNGLVYSSVDAPIISSYAVTTQPGSIFCTSYKDMSKMDTSDFLRPLPTLENQSHPESYDFLSTTAIRDVPTEALSRAFPMVIPTVTTLPGSYLEASLEAISLQSFTTASPQQEYQRERELLELEKMKQLRLAEELEWERQEIQRFREEEQLIVQHELEELQTMKHQLLLQQEEERKAHLMMQQETYVQQKMQLEQIQQLKQQLQEHIDEQKMRQMYPYQNTPAQCSEQILQDVQCLRDVNGQFWPVQDKTTVPSTNVGFESQQASQHLPSHEKPQKDTIAQEPLELCNKIQKLSGKKKIVDSGVQTDGEEVAEKVNAGKRRKNKKSIDSSVQTDDEDHDEWDIPNRSRRRTRSSRSADSEKSKYGSKLSSISIQTVAEISVQTDQSGSLKRPVRAQVDTKVALSPQDILPRTDSADRKSPQRDKNRPTPLEIGYSTHLKADSTVAPSPPKSPKVLYSPVSPLSPKKQIEYSSYERSLRDTSPQKRLGPESIKCSSTGSCVRTVQHTASDGKNLNSPSGHSGKNSHCGLGTQKKVKRTLPNPPQEEEMTSGHAPYSTASARRRLCRNTSMARAKILQDIDRELELVERESSKLRKKQAELDEEEKEIDAKLRYLEMGICRRRDALLKEREKRERAYLQGVAEERDYMSDSEVSNVRETRINDIGLERPRTAPQPDFSQHVPTQTQPKSVYVQPTSPYTLYQYSTSTQAPQQALYQQPSFYHSQQTSPYQTQCVYSSVPTLSYPPASQQHHLSRNYHQGSQILLLQPKSRHTSFSELEPKVNGTYELVRNQSLLIAPPSNEVTYNVSHLGGKYGSLRLGLDERASIASSPMSSISADSYYADMDQHTPKNYVLLNDIGELTKTSTGLSTSFSIPDKDLAKADRLLHAAEMRDLLGPLQISRLHPCMKVQEDAMEEPYELKLLKQQIKQEFRRGPDGLEPTGLHHYYPSDSYRDLAKSEKYTIGRLTLEKQAAKQLPVSLLYQKQAKYKKALVDPKITKFSPIQETRDLVQDYSTYLASSTTSLSGLASRAKLLQDDITFGLRKSLTEHQKYLGSTLGANLAQSLNLGHTLNLSSHRSSLHEETLYASANRSRPSSRPSSVCGLDLSIKRDLSSSSLRLRTESDGISLVRNKPTSLPISQSKGRIPIIAQNSEEESPLSPVGQPMGMARASAGPLPPISADVRDQFGSNHSLPEVQQHMKEESRTSVYDRNLAYLMDNPQGVVSDFEAGRRWSTEVQNVLQEDPHWFDKPRGTNTQYGHIPGWIHGSQNQVGPGFYPFPHTRVKISRDPKDHSIAGNEHGIRVVGGKEIPGSRREIGAYVAQVVPGGPAEQTGKIAEGMQVLEWNNVPLTGKTYEDVQGLVSQPCTEVEICVRQDLNMLSDSDCPQDVQLLNPSKAGERLRSPGIQTTVELHKVSHQYLPSVASVAEKGPHFSTVHHQQSQSASPSGGKKRQSSKSAEVKTQNRPITGDIQLQLNYDKSLGNLIVHVLQARNLAPRDSNGYSDPFVKVYLLPGRGQVMVVQNASVENKRRSKSVQRNPEWNQTVIYKNIHLEQLKKKTLEVSVWDYDRTSSNDFLGEALIDLSTTAPLDNTPHWHTLKEQSESITHGRSHQSSSAQNPKTPVTKSRSHGVFPDPSKVSDLQLPGIEKSHSSPGSSKSSSETHLRSHGPSRSQSKSSVTQAHLEDAGVAIAAAEAAVQQLRLQPTRSSHRSTDGPTAVTTSSGLNLDDAGIDSAIFQIPRLKTIPNGTDKLQGPDSDNEVGKTKVMGEIKIALKKENRTEGEQLIIEILQCRNITYKFKSPDHLPDLYVKLYVVNVATQKRVIKKKTRVCRHDREPSFNETFRFNLNPTGHSLQVMGFEIAYHCVSELNNQTEGKIFLVSNGGKFVKKTMIGEAYVWLDKVDLRKRTASWHKLLANSPHMHG